MSHDEVFNVRNKSFNYVTENTEYLRNAISPSDINSRTRGDTLVTVFVNQSDSEVQKVIDYINRKRLYNQWVDINEILSNIYTNKNIHYFSVKNKV